MAGAGMETCGIAWGHVAGCGGMWQDVLVCGRKWAHVAGCGGKWQGVGICDKG